MTDMTIMNNYAMDEGDMMPGEDDACAWEDAAQMREELERLALEEKEPAVSLPAWVLMA